MKKLLLITIFLSGCQTMPEGYTPTSELKCSIPYETALNKNVDWKYNKTINLKCEVK